MAGNQIAHRVAAHGAANGAGGAGPADVRARAGEPEFLGFVLDFLLTEEAALVAFARAENIRPEAPMLARAALPGGALPHWT